MAYDSEAAASLVARLNVELRDAEPQAILRAAIEHFGDKVALVSSFGAESAVLLHMAAQIKRTCRSCSSIPACCSARPWTIASSWSPGSACDVRDLRRSSRTWRSRSVGGSVEDRHRRLLPYPKVLPLDRALEGFDGWITGRKRFQGGDRLRLQVVEQGESQIKFNPLANWTKADLDAYAAEQRPAGHPLVAFGYPRSAAGPARRGGGG